MATGDFASLFEPAAPLLGMTGADLAKLLDIPADPAAFVANVANVANVAGENGWPVLNEEALHGLAGDVVRAIAPESESDPAAILMQFLLAFGNVIGTGSHCHVESSRHNMNLFCVLVGESSKARKGTSWNHIRAIFESVDRDWTDNRVTDGLSSAEGLINEVRDRSDSGDERHAAADKRLLAMQGEFASVLKVMTREGNTLSAVLRNAWDGGTLRTLVKHNPLKATGAHISMIGHITKPELLKYLSDTESHNGFANRLLWVCVRRSKFLPEGGRVAPAKIEELSRNTAEAARWARDQRELQRDDSARELWRVVYPALSDSRPGLLGAATGRAEAQVLRLSAIYAALDRSARVRVDHLRAALAVWDYVFASARLIFGDTTGDAVADRIREALESAGPEGMSRTEIRDLFKRHSSNERIGQALSQLERLGMATRTMVQTPGRPFELWSVATKATEATKGSDQ